jgi:hypothetical protein
MEIKTVKLEEIKTDPNNARKHSEKNLAAISASLDQFGQRKPIVIHNGVIIAGNGTYEAAKGLKWKEISVVEVPEDWDADKAKAFALADNRSAELAEWDEAILATQLVDLSEMAWDIEGLGFEKILQASADDWADAFDKTSKEQSAFQQVTFTLSHEQVQTVNEAITASVALGEFPESDNTNRNGNALTRMAEIFLGTQV